MIVYAGAAASLVILAILGLLAQVPAYRRYWNKRAQRPIPKNAVVYVALGDSTAQGIGATSPGRGYVGRIANALEKQYDRPVHVVNLSKSGARIEDCIKEQLPILATLKPDVITVEIGANDMSGWDKERFARDTERLISKLPKHTVISDMPYFGGGRYKRLEPRGIASSKIISRLARAYGLRTAPLHRVTKVNDSVWTMAADFFHPSNKGYQNWFEAFWQVLQK